MTCKEHFADTGFLDLFPLAQELAQRSGYNEDEMIEAVCLTFDKAREYPPIKNRHKWFQIVFAEKLTEARAQIARSEWVSLRQLR